MGWKIPKNCFWKQFSKNTLKMVCENTKLNIVTKQATINKQFYCSLFHSPITTSHFKYIVYTDLLKLTFSNVRHQWVRKELISLILWTGSKFGCWQILLRHRVWQACAFGSCVVCCRWNWHVVWDFWFSTVLFHGKIAWRMAWM